MSKIERQIQVSYRHQIHFTEGVFSIENSLVSQLMSEDKRGGGASKVMIVADKGVLDAFPALLNQITEYFDHYRDQLELVCHPIAIEGGENCKNSWGLVESLLDAVNTFHIDRHSYIVAIGGGAILDMVGLAAAVAHRGVRHIRIPTTTLSQDDSGVGVKNGINFFGKKNFLGTFAPPFAVVNDMDFIAGQPVREKKNGYIEAVKVALIRDASFFNEIEKDAVSLARFEKDSMQRLIFRCAELHVNHIATSGDPFEFGSARPLDFGHWAAHKLEQLSQYEIRHGEAVAIGISLDTLYARNMGFLSSDECDRILKLIHDLGFELFSPYLMEKTLSGDEYEVLRGLEEFREHLGGILTITLLKGIGEGFEVNEMDREEVMKAMHELEEISRRMVTT